MSRRNEISDRSVKARAFMLLAAAALIGAIILFAAAKTGGDLELDSKIHINSDPVESIARLPGVGEGIASDIVKYRQSVRDEKAFRSIDDLCRVEGIGQKKAEAMMPYISFD
jgi:competence protein ComEA